MLGGASLVGSHFLATMAMDAELIAAGRSDPRTVGAAVSRFEPIDLSGESRIRSLVREASPDAVVNFAARTDVDGCEKERPASIEAQTAVAHPESALTLNAHLPCWLAEATGATSTPFIQISTDYVFDGGGGPYPEDAEPDPLSEHLSWYGFTKGLGEREARRVHPRASILRIAHPYRSHFPRKLDFARTILARSATGTLPPLYTDQVITPTWIPDVSRAVRRLVLDPEPGVFHVASPEATSPFEFGRATLDAAGRDPAMITPSTLGNGPPPAGRAPRPLRGGLRVRKVRDWRFEPTSFREGLRTLAREIASGSVPSAEATSQVP